MDVEKIKVCSFDIFDTILTRTTAQPQGIFFLMKDALIKAKEFNIKFQDYFISSFVAIRINGEKKARQQKNGEITLKDIYNVIQSKYLLTSQEVNYLMELEINTEVDHIIGIKKNVEIIKLWRKKNRRIIFISDMYLPKSVLFKMLNKVGAHRQEDEIYVSSEFNKTKHQGDLFIYILEQEKIANFELMHYGDNKYSDYQKPLQLGIQAKVFNYNQSLAKYYLRWLKENQTSTAYLLVGSIRQLDNITYGEKTHEQHHDLGKYIVGPILTQYVLWLLLDASKNGVKRLYFIARDGQILYEIANRIKDKISIDIELRYFYGSRQAWHLPAILKFDESIYYWLFVVDPVLTIERLAKRLSIQTKTLLNELSSKLPEERLNETDPLNQSQIDKIKRIITKTGIPQLVENIAKQRREIFVKYCIQEGLKTNRKWAIVDIGWHGNMQNSLSSILRHERISSNTLGYYFGLLDVGKNQFDVKKSFLEDFPLRSIGMISLLELFCAASHGSTMTYVENHQNEIIPKLTCNIDERVVEWGVDQLREGVYDYVRTLSSNSVKSMIGDSDTTRKFVKYILNRITKYPTYAEAKLIGEFPFCGDQLGVYQEKFAQKLRWKDIIRYLFSKFNKESSNIYWLAGSAALSSRSIKYFSRCLQNIIEDYKRVRLLKNTLMRR